MPVLILAGIVAFVFYKLPGIQDVPKATASGGPIELRIDDLGRELPTVKPALRIAGRSLTRELASRTIVRSPERETRQRTSSRPRRSPGVRERVGRTPEPTPVRARSVQSR